MDALLSSQKSTEIIPFSLDAPILYYPVRHHSPVCAWHLEQIIQEYQPECILVEGPENANDLIPILTNPDTKTPVALYYSYRDTQKLLSSEEGEECCQCYYPFLDQSPELVALRAAAEMNIPSYFIDLSYGEILLSTQAAKGFRSGEEKSSYASDRYIAANQFQEYLCKKAGVRSFEEFWEKYFETAGLFQNSRDFVKQLNLYCYLSRENTPQEQLEEDGCLAREAYMAAKIGEAAEKYQRILVVAGGFHIWGLINPVEQQPVSKIPKDAQAVYPMRYSMQGVDALSGYASGMPSPDFYAHIWKELHNRQSPQQAWETVVLNYLVKTGRKLRSAGNVLSAFDEICALQQTRGLAELREKPMAGLYELQDSVLGSFIKGEVTLSEAEPLRILRKLTTGNGIGQLCDGALIPPLSKDFYEKCKKYRLKINSSSKQETSLAIFSEPLHREISRFFYQSVFLDLDFASCTKGPDLRSRKNRNLIRETWEYHWSARVEAALIEHAVSGAVMEEACIVELKQRMVQANRAEQGADLLVQGFLMGIGDVADTLANRMDILLIQDGDFSSLCKACKFLNTLEEWQIQYDERGTYDYSALLRRCFARVLQLLPSMNTVDDHHAEQIQQACVLLYQMTEREAFADQREDLLYAFEALIKQNPIQPALHGTVLGLLYGTDTQWQKNIKKIITGYLQGTREMMLQSAAFLQGLFYTAKDILLVDRDFLEDIDKLLCMLSDEDFTALLPELRLAFSYFVPMETNRLAGRVAELHGAAGKSLLKEGVDAKAYTYGEAVDRWAAAQLDKITAEGEMSDD